MLKEAKMPPDYANTQSNMSRDMHNSIKILEDQFVTLARDKLGIAIHSHQLNELYKVVAEACCKFHCMPKDYLTMLASCPVDSQLLEHFVIGITIGETYFFRDKQQMQLLQEVLLPELLKKKRDENNLNLRIWSAGCSSGEEIYTVAMMLCEILPDIKQWTIKLLATDINKRSLQKAITGVYSEWSMRSISDYFKKHYFTQKNNNYVISEKIQEMVNFDFINLNDKNYPSIINGTNAQDLIICRNVLIYFSDESIVRVMHQFNSSLLLGGYLMLGASDPINIKNMDFVFHPNKGLLFSRQLKIPTLSVNDSLPKTLESNIIVKPLLKRNISPSKSHSLSGKEIVEKPNESHIAQLVNEAKWSEIINTLAPYEKEVLHNGCFLPAKANALANLGKLEEAVNLYQQIFKLDSTNKFNYFNYALTLIELDQFAEAESALRNVLFLDNQFILGHLQLGLLLIRKNKNVLGIKSLRNALTIVKTKNPKDIVAGSQETTCEQLVKILKDEISLYEKVAGSNYDHQD